MTLFAACGGAPAATVKPTAIPTPQRTPTNEPVPSPSKQATLAPTATPGETAAGIPLLTDGRITPGTYFYVPYSCHAPRDCSDNEPAPGAPGIEVTVPASGWEAATEFLAIWPTLGGSQTAALIMGWTNTEVGLNSEPCSQTSHQVTDIDVGPTVDDFVDAVVAHPKLDVTEPIDVQLGGSSGRFFTLTTPADQSACEEWRPWDPGFYAQGPSNIWDVWVMDVDGFRLLIVADYFPHTSESIRTQLRQMVESIRFVPQESS